MKRIIDQILVSRRRIRFTQIASVLLCLAFIINLVYRYIANPMLSYDALSNVNKIQYDAVKEYGYEGDILDCNNNIISSGGISNSPENYSFAWLLGYYSVNYGQENAFGLRGTLYDSLLFTLDENNHGATVHLTCDARIQNYAFENILAQREGSVVVLDNDSGAILALASMSTVDYDSNDPTSILTSDIAESQFRRGTYESDPPGSTYKVLTTAAALEKKKEENLGDDYFQYNDTGEYIAKDSDFVITNYGNVAYGQIDLEEALNNSVNCYFANLGVLVGQERMQDMAKKFLIGSDIEIPYFDTIQSNINFGNGEDGELAQIAFGQGSLQMTPLHIAMIGQTIGNDGVMMNPYIVESVNSTYLPIYKHFNKKLSDCLEKDINDELKVFLQSTAETYGFDEETYGKVYAKTGTAECADGDVHSYILFITDNVSVCYSLNDCPTSSELYIGALDLLNYIQSLGY